MRPGTGGTGSRRCAAALLVALATAGTGGPALALGSPSVAPGSPAVGAAGDADASFRGGWEPPETAAAQDTLTLREAERLALDRDPDVAGARATHASSAAGRWAQWGAFLPSASAAASFSRTRFTNVTYVAPEGVSRRLDEPVSSTSKGTSQRLSFDWTLLEGGRRLARLRQGAAELTAAEERLSLTERETVAEVRRRYYAALRDRRLMELAEAQLAARREELELTRERFRLASADQAALLGAELEVSRAELELLEARDAAAAAVRDLQVAIGRDPARTTDSLRLAAVEDPPDPSDLRAGELARRATRTHPELTALDAEAEAAAAGLWAARASYLPTVRVGYGLTRSESLGPEGDLFVFHPQNHGQSFSVAVSWNLFSGFDRRAQTAEASAQLRQVRARADRRELVLAKEVRDLVAEARRGARRLELLGRSAELARERLRITREQYRLGTKEYLDLQSAIEQLTRAERQLVEQRFTYLTAWANLEEKVGDLP